jgi:hypothetical protein
MLSCIKFQDSKPCLICLQISIQVQILKLGMTVPILSGNLYDITYHLSLPRFVVIN